MKITESQLEAIKVKEGNVLINASFGSGKSFSFISRIANLIANEKVNPKNILGLTFTRDAAENVRTRLAKALGELTAKQVLLTTFHSFAYRSLRSNYPEYNSITIAESWFENQVAQDIVNRGDGKNKDGHNLGINSGLFLDFVSYQKTHMVRQGYPIIVDNGTPYVSGISKDTLQSAFNTYCQRMVNAKKMSFDDMLLDFYYKLLEDYSLLDSTQRQYKYILVDEFQDTSLINMEILKLIGDNNIYAVGDLQQSIYSFQGAEVGNILAFKDEFENVKTITLKENFRSTSKIVDACNDLLQYRGPDSPLNQFGKQIPARNIEGEDVSIAVYNDEFVEARSITDDIIYRMEQNPDLKYTDFCIISRTNNGLLPFESELSASNIPVIMSSGGSFYDRREIDDLLSYAKLYLGDNDDAFRKVANRPNRYLANSMLRDLEEYAYEHDITVEQSVFDGFDAGRYTTNLNRFMYVIEDIRDIKASNAEKILREIYKIIGYQRFIEEKALSNSEIIVKKDAIERLFINARKFKSLDAFLSYVEVVKQNVKKADEGVILSTAHSAKGLEWDTVYVVNATDSNYPHEMLLNEDKDEELRLLFVALGRAKNKLQISMPVYSGKSEFYEPSRFLVGMLGDELKQAVSNVSSGVEEVVFSYNSKLD